MLPKQRPLPLLYIWLYVVWRVKMVTSQLKLAAAMQEEREMWVINILCAGENAIINHYYSHSPPKNRAASSNIYSKVGGKVWSWWLQYWSRPLRCHHRKIWIRPGDVLMAALSSRWKQQRERWCGRRRWWPRMPWRGCGHFKALVWWPGDEREGGFHLMVEFERLRFFDESAAEESPLPPCVLSNKRLM